MTFLPVPAAAPPPPRLLSRPAPSRAPLADPEALHPALWRARPLGRESRADSVPPDGIPSGFAGLDAQLPGGGWPRRMLTELLLPHAGLGEVRLLAPGLVPLLREGRLVMLFDPPESLCAWALWQLGIDAEQLLVVYTRRPLGIKTPRRGLRGANSVVGPAPAFAGGRRRGSEASRSLWALEQSLASGHVGAVLAWLPARLAPEALRRLQLAAQSHDGPAFMLREAAAATSPSPAPLRLALSSAGPDRLAVDVLKRRGPRLERPLVLGLPPVLPTKVAQALAGRESAATEPVFATAAG